MAGGHLPAFAFAHSFLNAFGEMNLEFLLARHEHRAIIITPFFLTMRENIIIET